MKQFQTIPTYSIPAKLMKLQPARAASLCAVIFTHRDAASGTSQVSDKYIAEILNVKPSTVASLMRQLVKNGHVVIRHDPISGNRLLILSCEQFIDELPAEIAFAIEDQYHGL